MRMLKRGFLIIAALIFAAFCFTACGDNEQTADGTMTLVIGTEIPSVFTVDLEGVEITDGVLSILNHLKETQGLEFVVETGLYGVYLTKVGALEQDFETGSYIFIYTSVDADFDVSAYAVSVAHEGKTLMSSGLGASEMTIKNDCIIYIGTIKF